MTTGRLFSTRRLSPANRTVAWQQQGFSLMEAMICVLVLSVGLLGLARLQARLWSASEQLHTSADAYLISRNYLEELSTPFSDLFPVGKNGSLATVTGNSSYTSTFAVTQHDSLRETVVATRWQDPGGGHEIRLRTLNPLTSSAPDSRWLLPGN